MKMRRHKHRQATLSRNQRAIAAWRAELRHWHEDLGVALGRVATAISEFIFNASEAWQAACADAVRIMRQQAGDTLPQQALRERG